MKTATSPSSDWVEQNTKLPVDVKVQTGPSTQEVTDLPVGASFRSAPSLRSKRIQRAALAAAALILSGFALLYVCKGVSSNLTEAGLAHRRLAGIDDHDEELDAILNQCLELEAEHGEPPPETEWEEPAAKKARLVAFLQEAAASHELSGLHSTLTAGESHISPSWTQAAPSSALQSADESGHIPPSWTQAAPSSALQSADEVLTYEGFSLPGFDINPDLNPNGFLEQIPFLEEEQGEEGGEKGEPSVLPGDKDQEQPSTSSVVIDLVTPTPSPNPQQSALERHPFYRLPDIEPGAIRRSFADIPLYTENFYGGAFFRMVKRMRELFLLPVLGPDEVEELMCATESLVCYLRNHRPAGSGYVISPSHAIRYLEQYFMILDSLLCARQLFGSQMVSDERWQAMTESIETDFTFPEPTKHATPRALHNYALVSHLIPAMKLMKAGARPTAQEIVTIKRMLLCSEFVDKRFKEPRWDPWRQDDAQSVQTHEDSSDDSEDDKN